MTNETKRRVQWLLLVLFVAAGIRIAMIFHSRRTLETSQPAQTSAPSLQADYYVQPKKLHDYDAESLKKDLAGKPVWIREGYRFSYYACDGPRHRVDFHKEAGTLGPIEKLDITDVISQPGPNGTQVLAVYSKSGHNWCLPVGVIQGSSRQIYADEVLFYEDPHQLYRHWTADVWQAIEKHEVKPGMNELQASFAVGMGTPQPGEPRVVHYPNGGHPLTVTYENGRATQITNG